MPGKAEGQKKHAIRRMAERFPAVNPRSEYEAIMSDIRAGRLDLVERQSKRVSVFHREIGGVPARVWYDRDRHTVVTVYPDGAGVLPESDMAEVGGE